MNATLDIVIIAHSPVNRLAHVLNVVGSQLVDNVSAHLYVPPNQIHILPLAVIQAITSNGIILHQLPCPMPIGMAREHVVSGITSSYVAFLDDDCVPRPGWLDAILYVVRSKPWIDMFFGPRFEAQGWPVGALIRMMESEKSRKVIRARLQNRDKNIRIMDADLACAGGNMVVKTQVLEKIPITSREFRYSAFEDVDFQIRMIKGGFKVRFVPVLSVDHYHPLSFAALLRKSYLSGRGIALCRMLHSDQFLHISRWARPGRLLARLALYFMWLPLVIIDYRYAAAMTFTLVTACWTSKVCGLRATVAWCLVKPLRDLVILLGFAITMLRYRSRVARVAGSYGNNGINSGNWNGKSCFLL